MSTESAATETSSPSQRQGLLKPLKGLQSPIVSPDHQLGYSKTKRRGSHMLLGTQSSPNIFSSPDTSLSASMGSPSPLSRSKRNAQKGPPSSPNKGSAMLSLGFILPTWMSPSPERLTGRSLVDDGDDEAEAEEAKVYGSSYQDEEEYKATMRAAAASKRRKRDKSPQRLMKDRLRKLTDSLDAVTEEQTELRSTLLSEADLMVSRLPLSYLASKPELRHYAMERAGRPVINHMMNVIKTKMKWALDRWKTNFPPNQALDERQVAFLVIADRLGKMLTPIYRGAFFNGRPSTLVDFRSSWAFAGKRRRRRSSTGTATCASRSASSSSFSPTPSRYASTGARLSNIWCCSKASGGAPCSNSRGLSDTGGGVGSPRGV